METQISLPKNEVSHLEIIFFKKKESLPTTNIIWNGALYKAIFLFFHD